MMNATEIATVCVSVVAIAASAMTIWRALAQYRRTRLTGVGPRRILRFTIRRVFTGSLLAVVALMLFFGVVVIDFRKMQPWAAGWYWMTVLALLLWLVVLAVFDIIEVVKSLREWVDKGRPQPPRGNDE